VIEIAEDFTMTDALETLPAIGPVLAGMLRAAGVGTVRDLMDLGDEIAFAKLAARFPEDACGHKRLALGAAVRGMRKTDLPPEVKREVMRQHKGLKQPPG
jgi:DNA transformation protein